MIWLDCSDVSVAKSAIYVDFDIVEIWNEENRLAPVLSV